jgi:hypothetical protein
MSTRSGTPIAAQPSEATVTQHHDDLDPESRVEAEEIVYWAARLHVTPEELRSAVQKGGTMVKDVLAELKQRTVPRG